MELLNPTFLQGHFQFFGAKWGLDEFTKRRFEMWILWLCTIGMDPLADQMVGKGDVGGPCEGEKRRFANHSVESQHEEHVLGPRRTDLMGGPCASDDRLSSNLRNSNGTIQNSYFRRKLLCALIRSRRNGGAWAWALGASR
jgi:hypothetical protein